MVPNAIGRRDAVVRRAARAECEARKAMSKDLLARPTCVMVLTAVAPSRAARGRRVTTTMINGFRSAKKPAS
jgi:hypothetical protein